MELGTSSFGARVSAVLLWEILAMQNGLTWAAYSLPETCMCTEDAIGNGFCDRDCFVPECFFDGGDCGVPENCPSGCYRFDLGDKVCNGECLSEACLYDGGDCVSGLPDGTLNLTTWDPFKDRIGECEEDTCRESWINDGICDLSCNVIACNFDGNDCLRPESTEGTADETSLSNCDPQLCAHSLIGDGFCDEECDNEGCRNDDGDCDALPAGMCALGCLIAKIGDGECDPDCRDAVECRNDEYDCLQSFLGPNPSLEPPSEAYDLLPMASPREDALGKSSRPTMEIIGFSFLGLATLAFMVSVVMVLAHLRRVRLQEITGEMAQPQKAQDAKASPEIILV